MENNNENVKAVLETISDLEKKYENEKLKFFFFVADTFGKPMGSIEFIYKIAKLVSEKYEVVMLHEKEKFMGVKDWMGDEYASLNHLPISALNDSKYQIEATDFFIVPEIYGEFLKNLKLNNLPCEVIVLCQSHSFITRYFEVGETWRRFGLDTVITTSEKMKSFLEEFQPANHIHIINPPITDDFHFSEEPQQPQIVLYARNVEDGHRIMKLFYSKYPMYGWVPVNVIGSLPKKDFAEELRKNCLAVFIDDYSTFGTFPLECMKSGVPVIIKLPELIPEWAEKEEINPETNQKTYTLSENAIYSSNLLSIPDYIAKFIESWLLDDLNEEFYTHAAKTPTEIWNYTETNFINQTNEVIQEIVKNKLRKIKATKEKYEK
jgi:hypothetical protein